MLLGSSFGRKTQKYGTFFTKQLLVASWGIILKQKDFEIWNKFILLIIAE